MKKEKSREFLARFYRGLIYALPAVLFFSYRPLISLGTGNTMNFELSLPLIWLAVFDVVALILMIQRRVLFRDFGKKWAWLLFPSFLTLSLIWSHDVVRGILTVGILWLLYFAVFSFVALKKEIVSDGSRRNFFKVFFAAGLLVCGWCLLQCVLDVAGVTKNYTLMCDGCVYQIFGFPHPNGFAAEPQFMGNLLLAPIIVSLYFLVKDKFFSRKSLAAMFFVFVATLFLTLSRGAIYAFLAAMVFFTVVWIAKMRKWKVLLLWPIILLAMLFTLNLQGVFAEASKTDDTYISGVSKAVNQLTLGVVDLGGSQVKKGNEQNVEENLVEGASNESDKEEAHFDGYVEISTTERVDSWKGAFKVWTKDFPTAMFGVGIGGAPIARYENGVFPTPKEIINNEYVSLLLETGIMGIGLLILTIVLIFRVVYRDKNSILIFTLIVAYVVSLCFFSGLPNALHIYLLPVILMVILGDGKNSYRKR